MDVSPKGKDISPEGKDISPKGRDTSLEGKDKPPEERDTELKDSDITAEETNTGNDRMDAGALWTGWFMLSIAIALFILSTSIFLWGLDSVFSSKRFPQDTDTPCFLAFLVMGIIFLVLGVVYRDMAVHPDIFEDDDEGKSKHLAKREEWDRIKQRVKEIESGKESSGEEGVTLDGTE